jgi:C4-dicarboxylate-specific signal transduction histidine kinase
MMDKPEIQALKKTLDQLSLNLKTAQMGIWEATFIKEPYDLHDLKWDEEVRTMHGVPTGKAIIPREWFRQNIHPDDLLVLREKMLAAFANRDASRIITHVYRFPWSNGEVHYIEMHTSLETAEHDENIVSIHGICRDITEDILKQKLIEDQKNRLLSASRMAVLGEISGGIAHEINNPLTVIQARSFQLAQMIEHGSLDPEKVKSAAESISKTADKIAKIVKSLRAFAQGQENEPVDTISVGQLIQETLDFCKVRFYNHGIDLRFGAIPEDLEFECHLIQIEEALLNLFNNAHDAISKMKERWILVEAFDKGSNVEIHITDSGKGIPDTIADNMMLPFFTTKEIGKGMGLGLCIAAEIINKHHGVLFLDRASIHTKFVVRVPKVQPKEPHV